MDTFDKTKIAKGIEFDPDNPTRFKLAKKDEDAYGARRWKSVIGNHLVTKGMKRSWKFKVKPSSTIIGIMETDMIKSKETIDDFTTEEHKGYGLFTSGWFYAHNNNWGSDGWIDTYSTQFILDDVPLIITMEFDVSGIKSKYGILKFIIHNETKQNVSQIKTDGDYTNIAYDDIDISKKYRLAFSIHETYRNKWVS